MSKKILIVALAALASGAVIAGDTYSALDIDKSGAISEAEAAALPGLTEQLNALDVDASGELSMEEFARFETYAIPATDAPKTR